MKSVDGDVEGALSTLRAAVDKGFSAKDLLTKDNDLKNVRGHRGYAAIVARVRPGGEEDPE